MSNTRTLNRRPLVVGAGIILLLVTGLLHLVQAPGQYAEVAYVGVLFVLNAVGAVVAAYGIQHGAKTWGWGLGIVVAGGALIMYTLSRTIGLPGMDVQDWFEPIGLLSVIVELLFVALSVFYLKHFPTTRILGAS